MAMELASYDFTKLEWVQNECTVIDFVKKGCYKKYHSYNDWLQHQKGSSNSSEERIEDVE